MKLKCTCITIFDIQGVKKCQIDSKIWLFLFFI